MSNNIFLFVVFIFALMSCQKSDFDEYGEAKKDDKHCFNDQFYNGPKPSKYDIENDITNSGKRFSCSYGVNATIVKDTFDEWRNVVKGDYRNIKNLFKEEFLIIENDCRKNSYKSGYYSYKLISKHYLDKISNYDYRDVKINSYGIRLGHGNIWLDYENGDRYLKISTVAYNVDWERGLSATKNASKCT